MHPLHTVGLTLERVKIRLVSNIGIWIYIYTCVLYLFFYIFLKQLCKWGCGSGGPGHHRQRQWPADWHLCGEDVHVRAFWKCYWPLPSRGSDLKTICIHCSPMGNQVSLLNYLHRSSIRYSLSEFYFLKFLWCSAGKRSQLMFWTLWAVTSWWAPAEARWWEFCHVSTRILTRSGSRIRQGAICSSKHFTDTHLSLLFADVSLLLPFRQVCLRWTQAAEAHSAHGEKQIGAVGTGVLGRRSDSSCWSSMTLVTLIILWVGDFY